MVKIRLIQLGDIEPLKLYKIQNFGKKSKIFSVPSIQEIDSNDIIRNNALRLLDNNFENLKIGNDADFSVIIVNRPLEDNYFTRVINNKLIAISINNLESIIPQQGISYEMFVTRFLLGFSVIFECYREFPIQETKLMHNDISGCLFDKCVNKPQISVFFKKPNISIQAIKSLNEFQLRQGYLKDLNKEVKKLRLSKYYFFEEWLKKNPIATIFITILSTIILSILANFIFLKLFI